MIADGNLNKTKGTNERFK